MDGGEIEGAANLVRKIVTLARDNELNLNPSQTRQLADVSSDGDVISDVIVCLVRFFVRVTLLPPAIWRYANITSIAYDSQLALDRKLGHLKSGHGQRNLRVHFFISDLAMFCIEKISLILFMVLFWDRLAHIFMSRHNTNWIWIINIFQLLFNR